MPRPRKRGLAYEPGPIDKELIAKAMGVFPEKEPEVYAFLSKALEYPLPAPWTEHADKKGRVFYWNPASRHSSWSHPLSSTHKSLVHAFRRIKATPPGEVRSAAVLAELDTFHKQGAEEVEQWRVSHAPDGTPYYYKTGTQQTRWDNPRDELVSHQELRICMLSELLEEPADADQYIIRPAAVEDDKPEMDMTKLPAREEADVRTEPVEADTSLTRGDLFDTRPAVDPLDASVTLDRAEPLEATWGSSDMGAKPDTDKDTDKTATAPTSPLMKFRATAALVSLLTPVPVQAKMRPDESGLVDKNMDVGWLQPDEIALHLGVDFKNPTDATIYAMLKPIFVEDLPAPWENVGYMHGRADFFHRDTKEKRLNHPMFWFFNELLTFLREQATSAAPLVETLTARIFVEASPQCVRNRLGVWEGPIQDPDSKGSKPIYVRLLPGRDGACIESPVRTDDPRLEAAANVITRLDAWHHLWQGFAPYEPFPLALERVTAIATQLGESVVLKPGDRADKEWVLHEWNYELEKRAPAAVNKIRMPWTREEAELQPKVSQLLGNVYSQSVNRAAYLLGPDATDKKIAWELLRINYRFASTRIEEEDDEYNDVADEYEEELELETQLSESEYTDDFVEEPPEDEDVPFPAPEEDVDSLSDAGSSICHRRVKRRGKGGYDILDHLGHDAYEGDEEEEPRTPPSEPPSEDELKVDTPVETPRGEIMDFLGLKYADHTTWATTILRPETPPASPRVRTPPFSARSLPRAHKDREAKGFDRDIWGGNRFLRDALIKPYVANLGWRLHEDIQRDIYSELGRQVEEDRADTTKAFCQSVVDSKFDAASVRKGLQATIADDALPFRKPLVAPLDQAEEPSTAIPVQTGEPTAVSQLTDVSHASALLQPGRRVQDDEEIAVFKETLRSSANMFDDYMADRAGLAQPLVQPTFADEAFNYRASARKGLARAYLPVREQLQNDDLSLFNVATKGNVPPPPSPENLIMGALPVPHYLLACLSDSPAASGPKPGSRPLSAGQRKFPAPRVNMRVRPSSAEARARKQKGTPNLIPERPDVIAQMAAEGVLRFLSRKCGRMHAVMELFDTKKLGFITREDWKRGLEQLEYDKMDFADQIFTCLDKQRHHVLTLSDLQGRGRTAAFQPERNPVDGVVAGLLQQVVNTEMQSVIDEALSEVLAQALRAPQRPLDEVPDVKAWLKAKRARDQMLRGEEVLGEQEGSDSDIMADLLNEMKDGSPGSKSTSPSGRKKKKKKGKGTLIAAAAFAGRKKKKRNKSAGSRSGSSRSDSASSRGRTSSPGSRSSSPKKKKKKLKMRTVGKLATSFHSGASSSGRDPSQSSRGDSPGSRRSSPSGKKKKRKNKMRSAALFGALLADSSKGFQGTASSSGAASGKTTGSGRSASPKRAASGKTTGSGRSASPKRRPSPGQRTGTPEQRAGTTGSRSPIRGQPSAKSSASPKRRTRPKGQTSPVSSRGATGMSDLQRHLARGKGATGLEKVRASSQPQAKAKQRSRKDGSRPAGSGTTKPPGSGSKHQQQPRPAHAVTGKDGDITKPGQPKDGDITKPGQQLGGQTDSIESPEPIDLMSPSAWAVRIGAMPASLGGKGVAPQVGPSSVDTAFQSHSEEFPQRKPGLLPWVPKRPEDVCKTYSHIFKLLHDPHLKKRMPKQKQSVHISMPRLPGADASAPDVLGYGGVLGGHGARSVPDLAAGGSGAAWRGGDAAFLDAQASAPGYVSLPPLAKSAPERRRPPDPLGGAGPRQRIGAY